MPRTTVTVQMVALGEPRTGGWCEHCNLPSLIEQTIGFEIDGKYPSLRTMAVCVDCRRTHWLD